MTTTPDPLLCAGFVVLAFIPAGLAHALWLRSAWARRWRVPLDGGRTWRGRRLLGDNKTWAGFVVLPPATALTFALLHRAAADVPGLWPLSSVGYSLLGGWAALGFMLGELPNSFVKRQLDVAPGAAASGRAARVLGFAIDRIDSLAGALLAVALVVPVSVEFVICLLLIVPALHWLFSALLWQLGVKGRVS